MAGFNQLANTSRVVTAGTANQGLGPCCERLSVHEVGTPQLSCILILIDISAAGEAFA